MTHRSPERSKVIFAGTPPFAAAALEALHSAGFSISLVLTQPDRPSGRGLKERASAVKLSALARGIEVFQPKTLRAANKDGSPLPEGLAAQDRLRALRFDVMVVAAYGLILPQEVLDIPPLGCINIHGSLLPRWRGAAPIQRAIEAGDTRTGISIMRMDAGLDTGPVLLDEAIEIEPDDTSGRMYERLARLGAQLIVRALEQYDRLVARPQREGEATYAAKIQKHEEPADFYHSAQQLARKIRAFNPSPGVSARIEKRGATATTALKFWCARACDERGEPGTVLRADEQGIVIACADGAIEVTELQRAGGKRLSAREFLAGTSIVVGDRFAS